MIDLSHSVTYSMYTIPLFKKTACIMLSGRAGVGKTTLAGILKEEFVKYGLRVEKFSFAQGVKETAKFMGWDGKKDEWGRQLLIDIGMSGRKYDSNTWCRITFDYTIPNNIGFPFDVVLIDDWRFRNEYDFIASNYLYHTFTARIVAPDREVLKGNPTYNDASETELENFDFDLVIDNSKDGLELLRDKSQELIKLVLQTTPQM